MLSDDHIALDELGWSPAFAESFETWRRRGCTPARLVTDHGAIKLVHTGGSEIRAELAGRLTHVTPGEDPVLPAVGDWVAVHARPGLARIDAVLARRSVIRRRAASGQGRGTRQQVLAANVDVAFVVAAADGARTERRIERYLSAAGGGGARAVVVLTKADLVAEPARVVREVAGAAGGAAVVAVSALHGEGVDDVAAMIGRGETAVLLGPSGVGKSTLLNRMLGEDVALTRGVRADGKGRHTTTHRQLFVLPGASMVIDTPGLRELQLWSPEDEGGGVGVGAAGDGVFADIDELATRCRFSDCAHDREPGCAVQDAIARGTLTAARLRSYRKLAREAEVAAHGVAHRRRRAAGLRRSRTIATLREQDL